MTIEVSDFGMIEMGKVIVKAMDNNGSAFDGAGMEPIGGLSADDFSKTESQKADPGHKKDDQAD